MFILCFRVSWSLLVLAKKNMVHFGSWTHLLFDTCTIFFFDFVPYTQSISLACNLSHETLGRGQVKNRTVAWSSRSKLQVKLHENVEIFIYAHTDNSWISFIVLMGECWRPYSDVCGGGLLGPAHILPLPLLDWPHPHSAMPTIKLPRLHSCSDQCTSP